MTADEDADTARMMLVATAILPLIRGMPLDLAISALMTVVADLIRSSRDPVSLWEALAFAVEINGRLQRRFISDAPERLQ
jgi:hypothetical protein